jgi:GNAT superfamily N-acetyltransferase
MPVFELMTRCRLDLAGKQIFQWDEIYPGLNDVEKDAREGTLFVIRNEKGIVASGCFNGDEPEEYRGLPWRCPVGKALVAHRLCVDPSHEGKGFGRALMHFATEQGRKQGFSCIRLDAYTGNPRSTLFYRHLGYTVVGQVFFPRRVLPFDCMEKLLGAN